MTNIKRCRGCGIAIQINDPNIEGYAVSKDNDFCQSCYRLFHYGEARDHIHPDELPQLKKGSLVLMVSSVAHLDMLFEYPVYRYQSDAKFVYIINQIDLLPKDTNLDNLLNNVIKKAKKFKVPYEDIILMSAVNKNDLNNLKDYLLDTPLNLIYLIGVQNSGKTTIFKHLTNDDKALALKKAALTQSMLTGRLEDKYIYDMPGLFQNGYMHTFMTYEKYKKLIPDKEIKPRIYQRDKALFLIEDFIAIDYKGELSPIIFYLSSNANIRYTKDEPLSNKDLNKDYEYAVSTFKTNHALNQITLADLGFIHVRGSALISIRHPKGMHISVTEALFKWLKRHGAT